MPAMKIPNPYVCLWQVSEEKLKKILPIPRYILTEVGVGYRFVDA